MRPHLVKTFAAFLALVALVSTGCSSASELTADEFIAAVGVPALAPVEPQLAADQQSQPAGEAEPARQPAPEPTAAPSQPSVTPARQPAQPQAQQPDPSAGGVMTGVIDVDVAGVADEVIDRSLFLSPLMQERLDALVRPDNLADPHPRHAVHIGGLRRVSGDRYSDDPAALDSDVRFFDWANVATEGTTIESATQSYVTVAEAINDGPVTVGPRDSSISTGSPSWIIEPNLDRGPHNLKVDTQLRFGGSYGLGQLLTTRFRFAHRDVALPTTNVADTMPAWVREESQVLTPLLTASGLEITGWDVGIGPDWTSGEPLEARGRMAIIIDVGTTGWVSADAATDVVAFEAMRTFGQGLHTALGAPEAIWSSETDTSGSFNYRVEATDRDVRLYIAAGPSTQESYVKLEIIESEVEF